MSGHGGVQALVGARDYALPGHDRAVEATETACPVTAVTATTAKGTPTVVQSYHEDWSRVQVSGSDGANVTTPDTLCNKSEHTKCGPQTLQITTAIPASRSGAYNTMGGYDSWTSPWRNAVTRGSQRRLRLNRHLSAIHGQQAVALTDAGTAGAPHHRPQH